MIFILVLLAIFLVVLIYAVVYIFSHNPRQPLESESYYITNGSDEKRSLPQRILPTYAPEPTIDISVVVPCYNEKSRLFKMMKEAVEYLDAHWHNKYEILIVDDASVDGTHLRALEFAKELELPSNVVKSVQLAHNRGKGGAVTHGLLHALGKYCLFADADGATKFSDASRLLSWIESQKGPAVAIGLRAHLVNSDAVVKRSFIRNFLMYGLHTLNYVFGIRTIHDTQCGFKLFNRQAIQKIFPFMHTERWIFDVEVLLLAQLQSIPVEEIPVSWTEIDGSKVDLARDSIQMAIDLVVTRMAYLLGIYSIGTVANKSKKED